jgi:SAM-dependent methyltransferase
MSCRSRRDYVGGASSPRRGRSSVTESDIGRAENAVLWRHFQQHEPDVFTGARPRLTRLAKGVMRRCGRSPVVLTIGIGDGTLERLLRDRGCDVYSLDPDESTVERLRSQGMHAQTGFIETMPYKDALFDAVVASEVLEHLTAEQSRRGLEHVARVLKIGGWFIGTVPYREILDLNRAVCPDCGRVFHRWGHCRSFDEATLRAELEQQPVEPEQTHQLDDRGVHPPSDQPSGAASDGGVDNAIAPQKRERLEVRSHAAT